MQRVLHHTDSLVAELQKPYATIAIPVEYPNQRYVCSFRGRAVVRSVLTLMATESSSLCSSSFPMLYWQAQTKWMWLTGLARLMEATSIWFVAVAACRGLHRHSTSCGRRRRLLKLLPTCLLATARSWISYKRFEVVCQRCIACAANVATHNSRGTLWHVFSIWKF